MGPQEWLEGAGWSKLQISCGHKKWNVSVKIVNTLVSYHWLKNETGQSFIVSVMIHFWITIFLFTVIELYFRNCVFWITYLYENCFTSSLNFCPVKLKRRNWLKSPLCHKTHFSLEENVSFFKVELSFWASFMKQRYQSRP